jgi:hypothetical protein
MAVIKNRQVKRAKRCTTVKMSVMKSLKKYKSTEFTKKKTGFEERRNRVRWKRSG